MFVKFSKINKCLFAFFIDKAMKTAINAVAPIEPFKLFYKIDKGVNTWAKKLMNTDQAEEDTGGIIRLRAAGLSQLGYACFWPHND